MKDQENIMIGTTAITAAAPDAPQNLTAIAAGPARINLTWDTVTGATRYQIYRSTTADGIYALVGLTAAPPYTDKGLTPNTVYFYRVTAVIDDMESALSNTASAATDADIPVPTDVLATPAGPTRINLTWSPVQDAIAYAVFRSTTPSGTYQYVGTTSDPAFGDTGLTPSTTYYYRVAAIIGGMEGSQSAYVAATTYPAVYVPPTPADVQAQALSCTKNLITWTASAGAEGYHVYRSESLSGPYQLVGITASTTIIDTGLSPCTTYYYFVQAYTGDQFSSPSTPVSATTPSCGSPVPPCQHYCCPRCGYNPCRCPREPQSNPCRQ